MHLFLLGAFSLGAYGTNFYWVPTAQTNKVALATPIDWVPTAQTKKILVCSFGVSLSLMLLKRLFLSYSPSTNGKQIYLLFVP